MKIGPLKFHIRDRRPVVTATNPWYERIGKIGKWTKWVGMSVDVVSAALAIIGVSTGLWIPLFVVGTTLIGLVTFGKRVEVQAHITASTTLSATATGYTNCPECEQKTEPGEICEECGYELEELS